MLINNTYHEPFILPDDYCFVTAFYDINRSTWDSGFSRSAYTYIRYFSMMVQMEIPLVVYIDDRYQHIVRTMVG